MIHSFQFVNDDGYKALLRLAAEKPKSFIDGTSKSISQLMKEEAGTEDVWGGEVELHSDLETLNQEKEVGPRTDAGHAKTIRAALSGVTPAKANNTHLWASLNCFVIPKYVPVRWSTSNNKTSKPSNFVMDHCLQYSGSDGRKWNAAARLWWMGELAERIAPYSQHGYEELLLTMASNVNFYHQTIDRTYLAANPKLLAVLYDVFLDGNEHLNITKACSDMLKSLNLRAGANALDMMDYDDLRSVVEEGMSPKG